MLGVPASSHRKKVLSFGNYLMIAFKVQWLPVQIIWSVSGDDSHRNIEDVIVEQLEEET